MRIQDEQTSTERKTDYSNQLSEHDIMKTKKFSSQVAKILTLSSGTEVVE